MSAPAGGAAQDELRDGLARFLGRLADAPVEVTRLFPMLGGTLRHAWGVDVDVASGPLAGAHALIYLRDRGGKALDSRLPRAQEFRVLAVMHAAGVRVPRPYAHVGDGDPDLPGSGLVLERVEGEVVARRILTDRAFDGVRARLLVQMGAELARIHGVGHAQVPGLGAPRPGQTAADAQLAQVDALLREVDEPHPALELGLRWLARRPPPPAPLVVVHGDYRLGNVVVDVTGGLRAVLDWELTHVGDPGEDLGWASIRFWQGIDHPGERGLGPQRCLLDAYARAGGRPIDADLARYWEVLANVKWAAIMLRQARRHLSGRERSVELAAIGRRCAEVEWETLRLLRSA